MLRNPVVAGVVDLWKQDDELVQHASGLKMAWTTGVVDRQALIDNANVISPVLRHMGCPAKFAAISQVASKPLLNCRCLLAPRLASLH